MIKENTFKIKVVSDKPSFEYNLLDDAYLSPFSMTSQEVQEPNICFAVPGYLYEEIREASSAHPCAGSACMTFLDPYGQPCSIDFISYYDFNPAKKHAGGKPHWNNEVRFMRNGIEIDRRRNFVGHVIEDSSKVTLVTDFKGTSHKQTIYRNNSS